MDDVRGIVWVMWHADGIVGGGGWRSQCRLSDVARGWRCGGWWTASATLTGDFGCDRNGTREVGAWSAFVWTVRRGLCAYLMFRTVWEGCGAEERG